MDGRSRMLKFALLGIASVALAHSLGGCASARTPAGVSHPARSEVRVSAATTLKAAFEEMAPAFEKANGVDIVLNFGASGVLQKQIEGGAPVDVFASASPKQIDELVKGGFVSAEATSTLASNDLVIITPRGNPKGVTGPADLANADRLATGNPETAPHGTKAKEWLDGQGMWPALEPKFVFAENAAQTFDYVVRGEVDAGVVFGSEAFGRDEVDVVCMVPEGGIEPIEYVIAPVRASSQRELAEKFIEFALSAEGQRALADNGFKPAPARAGSKGR